MARKRKPQVLPPNRLEELDLNDMSVELKDVKFSYDIKNGYLLDNINMTFPRSAIYGLLGPSGCGKTTLIKLIVGRLQPLHGTVKLNGRPQSDPRNHIPGVGVGYMPQDICLSGDFTIYETLNYFSKVYGLPSDYKKTRIEFLIKFLELPDQNRLVGVLSGGQKRRVSLAVAIIHNPPLLILDEPTVGVDPMLRERIWEHLLNLSKEEKTSILITTHYIEECRRAHAIALVRNGKILVENSPYTLLTHFGTNNLEEVFLKVCQAEDKQIDDSPMPPTVAQSMALMAANRNKPVTESSAGADGQLQSVTTTQPVAKPDKVSSNLKVKASGNTFPRLGALMQKNLLNLWRQKMLFLIQIVIPMICIALFCLCIGGALSGLDIAVYNQEALESVIPQQNQLSSLFVKSIDTKTLVLIDYPTKESAYESVETGVTYGDLVIGKNFTLGLYGRASAVQLQVSDKDIEDSTVHFYADLTDLIIFQTLYKTLLEANFKFMVQMIEMSVKMANTTGPQPNTKALNPVVNVNDKPIYGSKDIDFRSFTTPGLIILVHYMLAIGLTALSTITERREGILERGLIAGVRMFEIVLAQILVQIIILVCQSCLVMLTVFGIFNLVCEGSYILIMILSVLQGICGMCFGLLVSAMATNTRSAVVLVVGLLIPYMIISGIVWPLEGMDQWVQWVATPMPQTLPVIALRNIMLKGWSITRMYVWLGYVSTIAWIIGFTIVTIILNNLRKD